MEKPRKAPEAKICLPWDKRAERDANGFWRAMCRLKAIHKRVSLADCSALALANDLGAVLLAPDHNGPAIDLLQTPIDLLPPQLLSGHIDLLIQTTDERVN
jgi:hypothetical protein